MATNNEQRNTFVSVAEQIALLNANNVEALTKLNDIVTSDAASVTMNYLNTDGTNSTYNLPTIGYVQKEIDVLKMNYSRLFSLTDNSVHLFQGNSTKKLYLVDLNGEPNSLSSMNAVSKFSPVDNWFFESLFNPLLTVKFDLSNQVESNVRKVLSRRYMVRFETSGGQLTTQGQASYNSFNQQFMSNTTFTEETFLRWHKNPTNVGVINNTVPIMDDQLFEFDANVTEWFGFYTCLKQDVDSLNDKLWYTLNHLNVYDKNGNIGGQLKVDDELIINKKDTIGNNVAFSNTRWVIREIRTEISNGYQVVLEAIEGYEPVPQNITNGLKLFSKVTTNKTVSVSVGVDEYNVVFLKPINTDSNLMASSWSPGVAFFTNDLSLDTSIQGTKKLKDYYNESVLDFGISLKQLTESKKPRISWLVPAPPVLLSDNFYVTQINNHITDTTNSQKMQQLTGQKTKTQSDIDAGYVAIENQKKKIYTTNYASNDLRIADENVLKSLVSTLSNNIVLMQTYINQISALIPESRLSTPKFALRGFWPFPDPTSAPGYKNQEIVQFKVRYKYKSIAGNDNNTNSSTVSDPNGTTQPAYFSNWVQFSSELRGRSDAGVWEQENLADGDIVNINQIDLPMNPGEQIEFQVKSISEAGWPDWPMESDWSESLTMSFDETLVNEIKDTSSIEQQNMLDKQSVEFQSTLTTMGIPEHISQSYLNGNKYISHLDTTIQTSFNEAGTYYDLASYLKILTDKISALEDIIADANGKLIIEGYDGTEWTKINNNDTVIFNIDCEKYAKTVDYDNTPRNYYNYIYTLNKFKIRISNLSISKQLGLSTNFTYRDPLFYSGLTNSDPTFIIHELSGTSQDTLKRQLNSQFVYLTDNINGRPIYNNLGNYPTSPINSAGPRVMAAKISNTNYGFNFGIHSSTPNNNGIDIYNEDYWNNTNGDTTKTGNNAYFLTTVHPILKNQSDLQDLATSQVHYLKTETHFEIPLSAIFKLEANDLTGVTIPINATTPPTITKSLGIFFKESNNTIPVNFEVQFNFTKYSRNYVTNLSIIQ